MIQTFIQFLTEDVLVYFTADDGTLTNVLLEKSTGDLDNVDLTSPEAYNQLASKAYSKHYEVAIDPRLLNVISAPKVETKIPIEEPPALNENGAPTPIQS